MDLKIQIMKYIIQYNLTYIADYFIQNLPSQYQVEASINTY